MDPQTHRFILVLVIGLFALAALNMILSSLKDTTLTIRHELVLPLKKSN